MAANGDDDYHSSDDEDYNPDDEELDPQDEIDDVDGLEPNEEDILEVDTNEVEEKQEKSSEPSEDVDAFFAALTGEDPLLAEINRRKQLVLEATTSKVTEETTGNEDEVSISTNIDKLIDNALVKQEEKANVSEEKTIEPSDPNSGKRKKVGLLDAAQSLSKRTKVSVLEKSDNDWKIFKNEQNIKEDLESHNRGKGGYLNKMEFLNRTDNRQFENEKKFRATARKDNI